MEKEDRNKKLRGEAEARLKSFPELAPNLSPEKMKSLWHELRVHQVELEMQNEELRKAQQLLEESRDQYTDLFDFAPVGYFVLNRSGVILHCNLTGTSLLGIEREQLKGRPFSILIAGEAAERRRFQMYLKSIFRKKEHQSIEININRKNDSGFTARLDTSVLKDDTGANPQCRMTLSDISGQKREEKLLKLTQQLQQEKDKLEQAEADKMDAILEAQEKERSRIAAELHEGIIPLLSMAKLNIDAFLSGNKTDKETAKSVLQNVISLLESAMDGIKEVSSNISPALLRDFGLPKALEYLCHRIQDSGLLEVQYITHGMSMRVGPKIELNLYRITQELLNNIIKHAGASEVEVQLIRHPNSILLMVNDNGIGFDQPVVKLQTNGFGFRNIAARVKLLNGRFDIDSEKGTGTTVTIELPI